MRVSSRGLSLSSFRFVSFERHDLLGTFASELSPVGFCFEKKLWGISYTCRSRYFVWELRLQDLRNPKEIGLLGPVPEMGVTWGAAHFVESLILAQKRADTQT